MNSHYGTICYSQLICGREANRSQHITRAVTDTIYVVTVNEQVWLVGRPLVACLACEATMPHCNSRSLLWWPCNLMHASNLNATEAEGSQESLALCCYVTVLPLEEADYSCSVPHTVWVMIRAAGFCGTFEVRSKGRDH